MKQAPVFDRAFVEALLDHVPTPMVLAEAATGSINYANRAAHDLAGGELPLGPAENRTGAGRFRATHPDGRPLAPEEAPSVRAARGEPVMNMEVVWHTPAGVRPILVQAGRLPSQSNESDTIVLAFEDISQLKQAERERGESLAQLDALFESAPIGLGYWDRQLRYVRVNEKLAEINGVPFEDHVGRTIPEVLPGMDPAVVDAFRYVLDTGGSVVDREFVGETPAASGARRHFSTAIYPVRDAAGVVTGVGAVIFDITERREAAAARERAHELERAARASAEEAAARARFLAEASVILDESLDYEATLASVSRLAVPWLADWAAVDILDLDGRLRRVTTQHVDPQKIDLAHDLERRYPTDPDSPTGVPNVIRTGKSEIYPDISDEMLVAAARDEEHLALIRSLGMRSAMAIPMLARGRTLGVITFVAAESGRRYDDDDLLLAEELARRAATSIDNARLYSERTHTARTLQASLLPPHLPDIRGLDLAARYLPVGEGNDVGGDFYDLFELGEDAWAMVIGDVCGKGAEAAALTALVRYTIRAIATADKRPSEVLRLVNDAILRQRSDNRFCTVAYARVSKSDATTAARVELSVGGHPLPLVHRRGAGAHFAGEPGTLLGVVPDPVFSDVALELASGDLLVFYTDGVSEAGAPDNLLSPDELAAVAARCADAGASEAAQCFERAAVDASGGDPHDDIAIVALSVLPVEDRLRASQPSPAARAT